jgi:hypothetical protein
MTTKPRKFVIGETNSMFHVHDPNDYLFMCATQQSPYKNVYQVIEASALLSLDAQRAALERENESLRVLIEKLLMRVNVVTAYHRHGQTVDAFHLDQLSERQIETEEKLEALKRKD